MRAWSWLLAFPTLACGTAATSSHAAVVIPTVYEAGHFYAVPQTTPGQTLRLVVDTGGGGGAFGLYWITAQAARRLRLESHPCKAWQTIITVAPLPAYRSGLGLPPPQSSPCGNVLLVQSVPKDNSKTSPDDGQFSGSYLYHAGVWTFDYPAHRLTLQGDGWIPEPTAHAAPLAFQKNDHGEVTFGYARIVVRVDGQPLDMLLDTGATAHPTAAGEKASHTPTMKGLGVTSYVVASMFERWHKAHPDWRMVTNGDDLFGARHPMRVIEVPDLEIAGWSVGPVWFTERPDPAFHDMMSSMMDRHVDGAVGGNVFRHFVMTLDYPQSTAYFRCIEGCAAVTPPPAP